VQSTQSSPRLAATLAAASRVVARVLDGASLNVALAAELESWSMLGRAAQDLCYGTLRAYGASDFIIDALARKPIADRGVRALLLCALFELRNERRAPHIIVDEAVTACPEIGHTAARGLVNALLRNYLRNRAVLEERALSNDVGRYGHPQWWIARLREAHPSGWQEALAVGNTHPPMTLRVNRRRCSIEAYIASLQQHGIAARRTGEWSVRLEVPRPVDAVPGFATGEVSVQDAGAQLAAPCLDLRDGMRVLDACAAPGGKTGHILELADVPLLAIDRDGARVPRIEANLRRLGLTAEIRVADAADPAVWWDGRPFDRILLDAPCSASGVVRRHPDIKWLRRETDLASFAREQSRLLEALWRVLAADGKLLYATCSLFSEENGAAIGSFAARHPDARRLPLSDLGDGQLLPDAEHDGFFYALLEKR
jgi:16S rRNA (cytosine967-C5)-methyltransferase